MEEQLLQQQQLLREKQEFDARRASRAQANIQPQPQITSEGPVPAETNVDISQRSASVARARPEDQITSKAKAKRARSASTSRRSPSPKRDYPRGTCTATRPSQASPRKAKQRVTPAQDLEAFKADMTSKGKLLILKGNLQILRLQAYPLDLNSFWMQLSNKNQILTFIYRNKHQQ